MNVFRDSDADRAAIATKRIAVLGYGSQGRAQALNSRDSGLEVTVGVRRGRSFDLAREDGFEPVSIADSAEADILVFCLPDVEMGSVFEREVQPSVRKGQVLVFAHGFAVHYALVRPPADVDVVLVAPMGAGPIVRSRYLEGSGVPAMIAVSRDFTGSAIETAKAYGAAIGCGRAAMLETTFREETESDLFGEQAVLCGGLPELIRASYDTLVAGGIQPEIAYIACLHEVKLIADLIYASGLDGMAKSISQTAEWGGYETGPRVIGEASKAALREALERIQSGEFARKWVEESSSGGSDLEERRRAGLSHPIHEVGDRVRRWFGMEGSSSPAP
jgi:ketol-acid reductoisomerase